MRSILFIMAILGMATALNAQTPKPKKDSLETDKLVFLKPFKAKLMESKKANISPQADNSQNHQKPLTYTTPKFTLSGQYDAPTIRPLAMKREKEPQPQQFYMKLGVGYPFSPLADVSYHHNFGSKFDVGATYRHHSAVSNKPIDFQKFSNHDANIGLTYHASPGLAFGGNVGYSNHGIHYYGYDTTQSYTEDNAWQRFAKFKTDLKVFNSEKNDADFNYNFGINYYSLSERDRVNETRIGGKLSLQKRFGGHPLNLEIGTDYWIYRELGDREILLPKARLNFTYAKGIFRGKFGIFAGADIGNMVVYPDVELALTFAQGKFVPYIGWTGDIRTNSFDELRQYNPFIYTITSISNSRYQERYGGLKGTMNSFTYDVKVAHRPTTPTPLFLTNYIITSRAFNVIYDTVNTLSISGSLQVDILKNLKVGATGAYHFYDTNSEDRAWGLPNLDINGFVQYEPIKKLTLRSELFTMAGVSYKDEADVAKDLNMLFDLNLGGRYQISNNFALFLDINNIINNKNERWYRYPQFGINFMGGIVLKF